MAKAKDLIFEATDITGQWLASGPRRTETPLVCV